MTDLNPGYVFKANEAESITVAKLTKLVSDARVNPLPMNRISGLQQELSKKIAKTEVEGLLDAKAELAHVHPISDIRGMVLNPPHTHTIDDVSELKEACEKKANAGHIHTLDQLSAVKNEVTRINHAVTQAAQQIGQLEAEVYAQSNKEKGSVVKKEEIVHKHAVGDICGLRETLNNKAKDRHVHAVHEVVGLDAALSGYAEELHEHKLNEIDGAGSALSYPIGTKDDEIPTAHDAVYIMLAEIKSVTGGHFAPRFK